MMRMSIFIIVVLALIQGCSTTGPADNVRSPTLNDGSDQQSPPGTQNGNELNSTTLADPQVAPQHVDKPEIDSGNLSWHAYRSIGLGNHWLDYDQLSDSTLKGVPSLATSVSSRSQSGSLIYGINSSLMIPRWIFDAIGDGIYYTLCYMFKGNRDSDDDECDTSLDRSPREAWFATTGLYFGTDIKPINVDIVVGADLGVFRGYYKDADTLFGTFARAGVNWRFSNNYGVMIDIRRSIKLVHDIDFNVDNYIDSSDFDGDILYGNVLLITKF